MTTGLVNMHIDRSIANLDLKRRIKAGAAKNRCHTISERSLLPSSLVLQIKSFSWHIHLQENITSVFYDSLTALSVFEGYM